MNSKKSKLSRKIVYGDKHHKKGRKYGQLKTGQVVASPIRQQYQMFKKVARGVNITDLFPKQEEVVV